MKITKELEQIIDVSIQKAVKKTAAEILKAGEEINKNDSPKKDYFKMTEFLLYNYPALKEQIASIDEYISTVSKERSRSIIYWTNGGAGQEDIEDKIKSRLDSFERTQADVLWIEQALNKIKDREEYFIIEKRYLKRKEDGSLYTYEEITDMYCEHVGKEISERTVRRYKTKLIHELSVLLFGSDVLGV
ncbi:hypothetical protein GND95_08735 [Defluviitalea raffinosedens]|uniref:DUF1492 domain-containing protein n=1 Tax=Defluviitalea raffinosedens TaxID=1450156 RepID=A0A7C8HE85_9FIRM|nr:hypothetical protein [Defluviitalea raffinosedens]KAE9633729.1 hypothetical protein GND95_08735 [Defluviitalea raffinosedens]